MKNIAPILLSTFAGLSTLIGLITLKLKTNKEKLIKNTLAFASGVMITISIIDLIPESTKLIIENAGKNISFICIILFTILGFIIPTIIKKTIKKGENNLYKIGILTMSAIIIHNIPEGIVTYLSSSTNIKLGIKIAIAITIHNIPEGISIAIPIYIGTNSKTKAILYTSIAAISEPLGALIAIPFAPQITNLYLGIIYAITAGIMTNISIIELLRESIKYNKKNITLLFFVIGILFMYLSIQLLN